MPSQRRVDLQATMDEYWQGRAELAEETLLRIRTAAQCNTPESVVSFVLKVTDPSTGLEKPHG